MDFYKICDRCGLTLKFDDLSTTLTCKGCGSSYSVKKLLDSRLYLNIEQEKKMYNLGYVLYTKAQYKEAKFYLEKTLDIDPNNYLAVYYNSICRIMLVDESETMSELISDMACDSLSAVNRSIVPAQEYNEFCNKVICQELSFVKEIIEKIKNINEISYDTFRYNVIFLGKQIRKILSIRFKSTDKELSDNLKSLCIIMINFLSLAVEPKVIGFDVDIPSALYHSQARSIAQAFYGFAKALDPKFQILDVNYCYDSNLKQNRGYFSSIDDSGIFGKGTSVSSVNLSNMLTPVNIIRYTYCTCYLSLDISSDLRRRKLLLDETLDIIFKSVRPQVDIDGNGDAVINALNYTDLIIYSGYINNFISEYSQLNNFKMNSIIESYYHGVYSAISPYFSVLYQQYRKMGDIIRRQKTQELYSLRKFFYGVLLASYTATRDFINYLGHNRECRIKLLRLGKQAGEAVLFLFNYSLDNISKSRYFADLQSVSNTVENDLRMLDV